LYYVLNICVQYTYFELFIQPCQNLYNPLQKDQDLIELLDTISKGNIVYWLKQNGQ